MVKVSLESILLKIEKGQKVSAPDLDFLTLNASQSSAEAIRSMRLFACIGEEGLTPIAQIRPTLLSFLGHDLPAVRVAVVEAIWQMTDREVLPNLSQAEAREAHPEVKNTMNHVIRVLG